MRTRWSILSKGAVLGAVMAFVLAACGGDPTATPRPATSAPVPTPIDTAAIVQQAVQEALTAAEKALDEATAAAAKAREADAAAAQAASPPRPLSASTR